MDAPRKTRKGSTPKRPRGRLLKISHIRDEVFPTHFAKVILGAMLDLLPIPDGFRPYLGTISSATTLKTNTSCSWMAKLKDGSLGMLPLSVA
jgi:hypothetical protein